MQFLLIAIAFLALMTAYVTSDFSVQNVWRQLALGEAAHLQDRGRVGEP